MIATIRATDHKDLPALSKFLVRAYNFEPSDFHFDPRLLEWKYLYPRAARQGSRSYLFERSGEIVAHGGICAVSFRLPTGRIVSGHVIVDWAADSRMPGLGVMLDRKLMQTASTSLGGFHLRRARLAVDDLGAQHELHILLLGGPRRIDDLCQIGRIRQELTRGDRAAAAHSCRHDRDLTRICVREERHDGIVAVVVGGLLLRSIDHPVGAIGSSEVRL